MKLGGIELAGGFGSYELVNIPVTSSHMPQEIATAFSAINGGILGATYVPLWYVGRQLVHGVNYLLICKEIRVTKNQDQAIVGLVINMPTPKSGDAKIVEIIEEAKLDPQLQMIFDTAKQHLIGVSYKPISYIGKQVVRGINYYFICEAKRVYPDAKPFGVMMCINKFADQQPIIVSIETIEDYTSTGENGPSVASPLGEWP